MNNKTIFGTIAGGITFFLLGWLIYGIVLMDYMAANTNPEMAKPMDSMIWWALILSNFIWAYFISLVFDWTNTNGLAAGVQKGLLLGLITSLGTDLGFYGTANFFNSLSTMFVDVAAICVMTSIVGGVIGLIRARGTATAS